MAMYWCVVGLQTEMLDIEVWKSVACITIDTTYGGFARDHEIFDSARSVRSFDRRELECTRVFGESMSKPDCFLRFLRYQRAVR
jgi:hypothetical protein